MTGFNLTDWCLTPGAADAPALLLVDGPAVVSTHSRAELRAEVDRLAQAFAAEFQPGARVALRMANSPAMAVAFFAAARAGLIAVPLSPQLTGPEVQSLVTDADAALLLTENVDDPALAGLTLPCLHPQDLEGRAALPTIGENDPVLLIYTSGTGGRPKGVLHAHRMVKGRLPMREGWLAFRPGDRVLHAGTLNWTYTLGVGLMDPLSVGATAVLSRGTTDPGAWPVLIEAHFVDVFAAVPTVYRRLLKHGDPSLLKGSRLRHGLTAGEALPAALWQAWHDATGLPLYEALGMSEISTYVSSSPSVPTKPGSPGKPQTGRRVGLLDPDTLEPFDEPGRIGLLAVHASDPGLTLGYWRRPDEDARVRFGEWFAGGDLASFDAEGYLHYHGRADDVMNALGVRTSPLEIEAVLARHPAVQEVAVTTTRNAEGVELITAFVVPSKETTVDETDLRRFAGQHLAAYKLPKRVVEVETLPRTANGKVQRKQLSRLLAEGDPAT
ncbi:MAG: class I adenylate-forming enzyme family protein [Pseudomonadota bacterium]